MLKTCANYPLQKTLLRYVFFREAEMILRDFIKSVESREIVKCPKLVGYRYVKEENKEVPLYRKYLCYDLGPCKIKKSILTILKARVINKDTTRAYLESNQLILSSSKPKFFYRIYL